MTPRIAAVQPIGPQENTRGPRAFPIRLAGWTPFDIAPPIHIEREAMSVSKDIGRHTKNAIGPPSVINISAVIDTQGSSGKAQGAPGEHQGAMCVSNHIGRVHTF